MAIRICVVLAMIGGSAVADAAPPSGPVRPRREFVLAINELEEGASEQDVVSLLGRPDQVEVLPNPPVRSGYGASHAIRGVWRYGTSGDSTLATLGRVYFDTNGRVERIVGKGNPPPDGMFEEQELRDLIRILFRLPSYDNGARYNPREIIRAVNALQPLGKDKALAAISEFLRVTNNGYDSARDGIFLVLRTLFDVPLSNSGPEVPARRGESLVVVGAAAVSWN